MFVNNAVGVAYKLTNDHGYAKIIVGSISVEKWMPGSVEIFTEDFLSEPPDLPLGNIVKVVDSPVVPKDLSTGVFGLAVGVVGENSSNPIVRLAVKGRAEDGWYPVSEIEVSE